MIFNQIILKRFEKEYNQIITYTNNNKQNGNHCCSNYYQNLVFESNDLMCLILQYLHICDNYRFAADLLSCSLVSSIWLYHAWNINSVYHVLLDGLFWQTLTETRNENGESNVRRMWQRLTHAKSIYLYLAGSISESPLILNKLSLFSNVQTIDLTLETDKQIKLVILKLLMHKLRQKIENCDIRIKSTKENVLSPLNLPNARYIGIYDLYFYRIWSNNCEYLRLDVGNITQNWCQSVIDNCDCSNIKYLDVAVTFDDQLNNEPLLKQLASKFAGIQRLNISHKRSLSSNSFDSNVILLWKFLKPIILKNNVRVEFDGRKLPKAEYFVLNEMIDKYKLTISKLTAQMMGTFDAVPGYLVKFVEKMDACGLEHLVIQTDHNGADTLRTEYIEKTSFESIGIFEINSNINQNVTLSASDINDYLGLKVIIEKQLFVKIDAGVYYTYKSRNKGDMTHDLESLALSQFDQLCKNISNSVMNQVGIDINLVFSKKYLWPKEIDDAFFDKCLQIYSSYFEIKDFLFKYKKPVCKNKLYLPFDKPHTYFIKFKNNQFPIKMRIRNAFVKNAQLNARTWSKAIRVYQN